MERYSAKNAVSVGALKSRRVFVAIKISKPLQEKISDWEKRLRELPVRWLAGKNLHVTLVPPWYETDVEDKISKLKNVRANPFELSFTRITYGPNSRQPRLVWAGGKTPGELVKLKELVENALGHEPENRPLLLHLTLARFRPEDFDSFSVKTLNETVNWKDAVKSFVLMESRLSSSGADYEVLEEFY